MSMEVCIQEYIVFEMHSKILDSPNGWVVLLTRILVISVEVATESVMSIISPIDPVRIDDGNYLKDEFLQ